MPKQVSTSEKEKLQNPKILAVVTQTSWKTKKNEEAGKEKKNNCVFLEWLEIVLWIHFI